MLAAVSAGAASVPDSFYMHPGKLVAVDGSRRLNLSCMGKGSPTVLFDSGMGDSSLVWRLVQGEVARRPAPVPMTAPGSASAIRAMAHPTRTPSSPTFMPC